MANLRTLAEADIPFRDKPMNIFRLSDWWGLVLGAAVFMVVVALAKPVHDFMAGLLGRVPVVGPVVGPAAPLPVAHPGLRVLQ